MLSQNLLGVGKGYTCPLFRLSGGRVMPSLQPAEGWLITEGSPNLNRVTNPTAHATGRGATPSLLLVSHVNAYTPQQKLALRESESAS